LTLWIDEQAVQTWQNACGSGARGDRPRVYTDTAIECALVVKAVFHLSLRATQGFLESVVKQMNADLPVPNYTTVSRRQGRLDTELKPALATEPRYVVIDSTGLKVFGAGEWYVRKHSMGHGRRRTWRKLHIGVDETTKDIVAVDLTMSNVNDSPHLPAVLGQVAGTISRVSGDRAYDSGACYEAILARGARPTSPPRRHARSSGVKDPPPYRMERDAVLRCIKTDGRYEWRKTSGATRQSLAENAVSRFKALLGGTLAARTLENQQIEALVKCGVLNRMTSLGLPKSERIQLGRPA